MAAMTSRENQEYFLWIERLQIGNKPRRFTFNVSQNIIHSFIIWINFLSLLINLSSLCFFVSLLQINDKLYAISDRHREITTIFNIGQSYENRSILVIKVKVRS
jgi:hypothetical protein